MRRRCGRNWRNNKFCPVSEKIENGNIRSSVHEPEMKLKRKLCGSCRKTRI